MEIKIYKTVKDFLEENQEILLENESVTQLILHNSFVNKEKETNKNLCFGRVEDKDKNIKLIFSNVVPYNLLIYSLTENSSVAVKFLVDYMVKENMSFKGINANKKICDELINSVAFLWIRKMKYQMVFTRK